MDEPAVTPPTDPFGEDWISEVHVVDDDRSVRRGLGRLLRASGYRVCTHASAGDFLAHDMGEKPTCLVLDVKMPDETGLELQERMRSMRYAPPIVFLTGHGDIPMSVRAMRAGAVDFLTKPVDSYDLLVAIERGLAQDRQVRQQRDETRELRRCLDSLTRRERQVLDRVVGGQLNKQIGYELGIAEKTVKVHRGRVMEKMAAGSLAELVRVAQRLGVEPLGVAGR
jgi:FixJ family two-component response regulator